MLDNLDVDMLSYLYQVEYKEASMIAEKLIESAAKDYKPAIKKYHRMSEIGKCSRAICYDWLGYAKKPLEGRAMLMLDDGNLHHRDLRDRLRKAGYVITEEERELYDRKWNIQGHIDGLIEGNGLEKSLLEIKTVSRWAFEKAIKAPLIEHIKQINLYLFYIELDEAILLYKCKDTSRVIDYLIQRDDNLVQELLAKFEMISGLVKLNKLAEPEYVKGADWQCDYCQFEQHCEGKKPDYPRAYEPNLDNLIRNYLAVKREYSEIKAEFDLIKKELKTKLRGYTYLSENFIAELKERKMPNMIKDPDGSTHIDEIISIKVLK